MIINELFQQAIESQASDIHLATGEIPRLRIRRELVPIQGKPLDREALENLLEPVFMMSGLAQAKMRLKVETTRLYEGIAISGVAFKSGDEGLVVTFRLLQNDIPDLKKLGEGAEQHLQTLAESKRGLAILAGPVGSGKWTTASAVIEHININRAARIFVVASHPTYVFQSKMSLVTALHVGQDCESYVDAMRLAHHSDLDVIVLDDLPTEDAVREALLLANTGHLVIANLHAEDSAEALRVLMSLGEEDQADFRRALAKNLLMVIGQRLFPRVDQSGRVPAYNWMCSDDHLREAILQGVEEPGYTDSADSRSPEEALAWLKEHNLIRDGLSLADGL